MMNDFGLSENSETTTEAYVEPWLFNDFEAWFSEIVELLKPELIVAIARGAVRLLQLHGFEQSFLSIPIISNQALPFMDDAELQEARILIFDDSLIFGSTMSSVRTYLDNRGAKTFCASYVVDRQNFFGDMKTPTDTPKPSRFSNLPIYYKHKLWPSEIAIHHDLLVRRILSTPRHYNLDFPTITISTQPFQKELVPIVLSEIVKSAESEKSFDVSDSSSFETQVYRFSILLPPNTGSIFSGDQIRIRPYGKIRLTFGCKKGEIRLTPIIQLAMVADSNTHNSLFTSIDHRRYWDELVKPTTADPYYSASIFRLLTAFVSTLVGKAVLTSLLTRLDPRIGKTTIEFSNADVAINVGEKNAQILQRLFENYPQGLDSLKSPGSSQQPTEPPQDDLVNSIVAAWNRFPLLKPHDDELVFEILGKIFLTLRWITDNSEVRSETPDAGRLEVGLSFKTIKQLLQTYCALELSEEDISFGMDVCIDNGIAVPKVLLVESIWTRLFYSGERVRSVDPLQFKNYLHEAYADYMKMKRSKALSQYDFHKLMVTLKDTYSWIPISTKYSIYGRISLARQTQGNLIHWLAGRRNAPLPNAALVYSETEEGRKVLTPNKSFRPIPHRSWPQEFANKFLDAFQYLAFAFGKLSAQEKLLLSTCKTHRHTYNSVAFEAHSWAEKGEEYNFDSFLSATLMDDNGIIKARTYIATNVYWCCRYLTEAHLKYAVFHHRFNAAIKRIDTSFKVQASPPAYRFWKSFIASSLSSEPDNEMDDRFSHLMPVIRQMQILTSYLTKLLTAYGFVDNRELHDKFESEGMRLTSPEFAWLLAGDLMELAGEYNANIGIGYVPGRSIVRTLLDETPPSPHSSNRTIDYKRKRDLVINCFDELRFSLNTYCPEYEATEGDFPFAPQGNKRRLSDGSTERILKNEFILTLDIIGSTGSSETTEMKDAILNLLSQFRDNTESMYVTSEVTGNDAYLCCADEPRVLLDIAEAIRMEGNRMITSGGRFGGTRKALAFGAVRVVERFTGERIIMDAMTPNIIPSAFSLLSIIDQQNKLTTPKNSLIVVDKYDLKHFGNALDPFHSSMKKVKGRAKHYFGNCFLFDMTSRKT
jgi:hypothetical protein